MYSLETHVHAEKPMWLDEKNVRVRAHLQVPEREREP
jgi:hypothetical protein